MSLLEYHARPLVAFDPSNKEHRRYYYEFLEYGGWGQCPVRFICLDERGLDLPTMIRRQMLDWYVTKEFQNEKRSKASRKKGVMGLVSGGKGTIIET